MRYAITDISNQTEVQYSGQKGICPVCNSDVKGRKAGKNSEHWYHLSLKSCDSWYEPITQWHLDWQNSFPKHNREVVLFDKGNNLRHRADIRLDKGFVIEIQNSFINDNEVEQRESFYGKIGMCWILNGKTLAKNCSLKSIFEKKNISINIDLPYSTSQTNKYDMDELVASFLNSDFFNKLKSHTSFSDFDIANGNFISIVFNFQVDIATIQSQIRQTLKSILAIQMDNLLAMDVLNEISITSTNIIEDRHRNILLDKKYWRVFIDKMTMPVYIDNLQGLDKNYLYNYSENKIIAKVDFINKLVGLNL